MGFLTVLFCPAPICHCLDKYVSTKGLELVTYRSLQQLDTVYILKRIVCKTNGNKWKITIVSKQVSQLDWTICSTNVLLTFPVSYGKYISECSLNLVNGLNFDSMRSLSWALKNVSASYAGFLGSWTCVCSEVFLCFAAGLQKTKRAMNTSVEKMQSHMGWSEHVDSRKPWKLKPDKWFERNKQEDYLLIHKARLLLAGPGLLPVPRLKNITANYACQPQPLHDTYISSMALYWSLYVSNFIRSVTSSACCEHLRQNLATKSFFKNC